MGIVALVVLEIFEKTGAYINRMFSKKTTFFCKNWINQDENNKQTLGCYGNSESGPVSCTDKFFQLNYIEVTIFSISNGSKLMKIDRCR